MSESTDRQFESLLVYLQQHRGFDFTGYKRPSLVRRVQKRMQTLSLQTYADYVDYLEVHPEEFPGLFNTVLINVTSFFRDAAPWEYLAAEIIPRILRERPSPEPIRVWTAGCATGEEAYSVAIAFAEKMGVDGFRERVKVYATDVDEEALNHARLATYTSRDVEVLDPDIRDRYFEHVNDRYTFRSDLRRAIIFGRHDLVQDAPISRLALLTCRNTLMYFNAEAQAKIMARFHFALGGNGNGPGEANGYLFLGRAELLLTHSNLFAPMDLKCRIFVKQLPAGSRQRAAPAANANNAEAMPQRPEKLIEAILDESPVPRIVVDASGVLVLANQKARLMFSLNSKDVGRPLQDLEISYRPAELRSLIEQAHSERRSITQTSVERRFPTGESQFLDIVVSPLHDEAANPVGASVTFLDMTRYYRLQEELQRSREEIQTANEELQSSNEELETTNEELQSSNEELETTNEELQSTNEELETMNEELQSTNEELQTVNEELRTRTDELNRSNAFLESVLTSIRSGAVVVDHNMHVLVWNERAADLWGLRADEVLRKSLLNLDIGLPVEQLRTVIRQCLTGEADFRELVLDATTRRGKSIRCRITCAPLMNAAQRREGAILLMDEAAA
jgi:two-component system, chemotaxis family, CheB/CheR fusion protein